MSKRYHDTDEYFDQEVTFDYEDKTYIWQGDYTVLTFMDAESDYAPAYGETEVKIGNTYSLFCFQDEVDVPKTEGLMTQLEIEIERNL
jgi:hypothetical protein